MRIIIVIIFCLSASPVTVNDKRSSDVRSKLKKSTDRKVYTSMTKDFEENENSYVLREILEDKF